MDLLTPYRLLSGNIKGFFNYINLIEKKRNSATKYLFVDMTESFRENGNTGIARVTNAVCKELYKQNLCYKIIEVYAKSHHQGFFDCKTNKSITVCKGDIFFGLDLSKWLIPNNKHFLYKMKKNGIPVYFFLHDILPITHPDFFTQDTLKVFPKWLYVISKCNGVIANSKTTMQEYKTWLCKKSKITYDKNFLLDYSYLGCDLKTDLKTNDIVLNKTFTKNENITFLAVSTIEPRKRYDQIINAFNILWQKGIDVNLEIVGRPGWKTKELIDSIEKNEYLNKKLFWHKTFITDQELSALYANCTAVLFATEAEGFGLPVIEASFYNKPLILRNLAVFKEIAGESAFYFSGFDAQDLSNAIETWLSLYKQNSVPLPQIKKVTWEECTKEICYKLNILAK